MASTALGLGLFLLGVRLLPHGAQGQLNTERMRALDVEGVRATLGSDVALQSGTVDLFEIGLAGRLDVRRGRQYSFLATEIRYGTKDGVLFRDQMFAHLRYNVRVLPWLETELFSQWEREGFARLQLRSLLAGPFVEDRSQKWGARRHKRMCGREVSPSRPSQNPSNRTLPYSAVLFRVDSH